MAVFTQPLSCLLPLRLQTGSSGGCGRDLIFLAVFNFQSRASSRVYGSFKTSGTSGMKANTLSNRKITRHLHQGSEDVTGLSVCHLWAAGELPENSRAERACPSHPSRQHPLGPGWGKGMGEHHGPFVRPREESGAATGSRGEEFPPESIPLLPSPPLAQLLHMLSVPRNWVGWGRALSGTPT